MFTLAYAGQARPDLYLPVTGISATGKPVIGVPEQEPREFTDLDEAVTAAWSIARWPAAGIRIYLTDPEQLLGEIIVDIERGELS